MKIEARRGTFKLNSFNPSEVLRIGGRRRNEAALSSLSMDLKRTALALYYGSYETADRFFKEALKRKKEIEMELLAPYLKKIINKIEFSPKALLKDQAEDYLVYSILLQNSIMANKYGLSS